MLRTSKLVGFVATARPTEAKRFYEATLGLLLVEDGPYALVFDANGTTVRVQKVQSLAPVAHTVLGWEVKNIAATVQHLSSHGVKFERYDGLPQDEAGVWRTPDGSGVAWFHDPDGNTLSLTERPGPDRKPNE
jgi:catechol 2,3-dioxygenase-like lactoylglutathione lyase family enzyme